MLWLQLKIDLFCVCFCIQSWSYVFAQFYFFTSGFALKRFCDYIDDKGRPDSAHIGMLVTRHTSDLQYFTQQANKCKNKGIKLLAIGLGSQVSLKDLQHITTKESYVYTVTTFTSLTVWKKMITEISETITTGNGNQLHFSTLVYQSKVKELMISGNNHLNINQYFDTNQNGCITSKCLHYYLAVLTMHGIYWIPLKTQRFSAFYFVEILSLLDKFRFCYFMKCIKYSNHSFEKFDLH